jgi:protein-disulfide isomerase
MDQPDKIDNFIPMLYQQDHRCGANDATIVLVEYGDYACPRSCEYYFLIKQIQTQLSEHISFVFRYFPQTHRYPQAQKAAETAEAAAAQNQFWPMHDLLCQNPQALADADLVEYAVQLNLDIPQVLAELAAHVHKERVQEDIRSGQQNGVQAAPALFISVRCQPDQDLKSLVQAISQALSASVRKPSFLPGDHE